METQSRDEHLGRGQTAYDYMKLPRSYVLHLHLELMQALAKGSDVACASRMTISPVTWALLACIKAQFGLVTPVVGVSHINIIHIVKS